MSLQLEKERTFNDTFFAHKLPQYYRITLTTFRKIVHQFVSFNVLYFFLFSTELVLFFFFLPFLNKSVFLAYALGAIFLTCFSYFVFLFYLQAKKPEQLEALKEQFLSTCREAMGPKTGEIEYHLSIAETLTKLAGYLHEFELHFYKTPPLLRPFSRLISRFSSHCYGEDVFKMKVLLLEAAIQEHISQIKITPVDLEVHVSLANTYVALSKVYREAGKEQFEQIAQLAIEEFHILSQYAPNDPWIHEQLALGYRDLGMPQKELQEMEKLFALKSQDKEILYKLGALYFSQGMNAKGLQIYADLRKANFKKAEDLVSSYGSFSKN